MGKNHNKIVKFEIENFEHLHCAVKFEVENFEHLCLELIKNKLTKNHENNNENNIDKNSIAPKMSPFKQQISICSFFAQKKYCTGWMDGRVDGWVDVRAGLRIAYSNPKNFRTHQKLHYTFFWIG